MFGDDSVRMDLVDEFGELITSYTPKAGHLVSPVALTVAPQSLNLGEVEIGDSTVQEIVFVNTGADEIVVSDLKTSDAQFQPSIRQLALPSTDTVQTVKLIFKPLQVGNFSATITVESNDPQSPFVISLAGNGKRATGVADATGEIPQAFNLAQNYPNPFNATTRISYQLPHTSDVSLKIFNIFGQQVRQFHFNGQKAGRYSITWDGRDENRKQLASGMYVYRLEVSGLHGQASFAQSKKMLMLK